MALFSKRHYKAVAAELKAIDTMTKDNLGLAVSKREPSFMPPERQQPKMTNSELKTELEKMINARSLKAVVCALSEVCSEIEQHVETNWQDKNLAKAWRKAELALDRVAINLPSGI